MQDRSQIYSEGRISLRTGKPYEESAVDSEWGL